MADRTVRAIFEARTQRAQKNVADFGKTTADTGQKVNGLTKDLKALDGQKVEPDIDLQIDEAKKRLTDLTADLADLKAMEASPEVDLQIEETQKQIRDVRSEIKGLTAQKYEVRVDAAIKDAKKRIEEITLELGDLRTQEVTPEVEVEIKEARKRLRDTKAELRELNAARATVDVDADTSQARKALGDIADDAADAGAEGGDAAGQNMVSGIIGALRSIPVAGAVVGVGVAIAGGLLLGIKEGLAIEAGRDLFSARTGLDEATSARFGRAAGEAYAQAWGDSVEANMETARVALAQGLIDADATDREIEKVITSLSGVTEIMQEDIPMVARAAGQLIKTGLTDSAEESFDVLVAGYQNGANASQDLLDTLIEYPTHFRDLGLSAEEATGLLIQGMEGGAFNSDKVADALKELTIRVKDLNDEAAGQALQQIGLNHEEMARKFAEGGDVARDALGDLLSGLRDVEDPAERAQLAVALFGTQAEDMAGALGSLDLSKAVQELGGVEGAADAADRALATMSDNASRDIEEAKRNIETAADGIKGALAAAFGDEISEAAEWVSRNRAPLMQFFIDVINGAIDAGTAFAEFGASTLDTIADLAEGIADMPDWLVDDEMESSLRSMAESARSGAETLRTEIPDALDDVQDDINDWAGPELMKARVHDATVRMSEDMDAFSAKVDESGGTVTINGDKVNAEEALDLLVEHINAEDGTVTIDGDRVPAEEALDVLMRHVRSSGGSVTIGGDDAPARGEVGRLMGYVGSRHASVSVGANTAAAEQDIAWLARDRTSIISVIAVGDSSGVIGRYPGRHAGGRVAPGLHGGGKVPGSDPGYDNVLWPLHSGGQVLTQPLTGGEWVTDARQTALWEPLLRAISAGLRPGDLRGSGSSVTNNMSAKIDVHGLTLDEALEQADRIDRREALSRRNTG